MQPSLGTAPYSYSAWDVAVCCGEELQALLLALHCSKWCAARFLSHCAEPSRLPSAIKCRSSPALPSPPWSRLMKCRSGNPPSCLASCPGRKFLSDRIILQGFAPRSRSAATRRTALTLRRQRSSSHSAATSIEAATSGATSASSYVCSRFSRGAAVVDRRPQGLCATLHWAGPNSSEYGRQQWPLEAIGWSR